MPKAPASAPEPDPPAPTPADDPPVSTGPEAPAGTVADPSLDPWNHPAIYPDWKPPYEGWTPPDPTATDVHVAAHADVISAGATLMSADLFV